MILKDEMQKRLNKEPIFDEKECKKILDEVQKHFLELQKEDNRKKHFWSAIACFSKAVCLCDNLIDYNRASKLILPKELSKSEQKAGIEEIEKILKDQFTDIKPKEDNNYYALELIIEL